MARQAKNLNYIRPSTWEYQEFNVPESDGVQVLFSWLRDGWEFVGFHLKTNTVQREVPVVIMRRERGENRAIALQPALPIRQKGNRYSSRL